MSFISVKINLTLNFLLKKLPNAIQEKHPETQLCKLPDFMKIVFILKKVL